MHTFIFLGIGGRIGDDLGELGVAVMGVPACNPIM